MNNKIIRKVIGSSSRFWQLCVTGCINYLPPENRPRSITFMPKIDLIQLAGRVMGHGYVGNFFLSMEKFFDLITDHSKLIRILSEVVLRNSNQQYLVNDQSVILDSKCALEILRVFMHPVDHKRLYRHKIPIPKDSLIKLPYTGGKGEDQFKSRQIFAENWNKLSDINRLLCAELLEKELTVSTHDTVSSRYMSFKINETVELHRCLPPNQYFSLNEQGKYLLSTMPYSSEKKFCVTTLNDHGEIIDEEIDELL